MTARTQGVWLNPPRHDDPHEDIIIRLSPAAAAIVMDHLDEQAIWSEHDAGYGDERARNHFREAARVLRHTADDIEAASTIPAEAGELSREATWHPANVMARLTPGALRNAARYQGPSYLAMNAIETAAAVAWSKGGRAAVDDLLMYCRAAIETAATTGYPEQCEPRAPYGDPVPPPSPARKLRRRKLGLPPIGAEEG